MNWKEFKQAVESQGVNDDTYVSYIDCDMNEISVRLLKPENSAYIE